MYSNNIVFNFTIGNLRIGVVNISKEFPNPNRFIPEHFHYDYELHIIESGKGYINLDGENFVVEQNDLYITAPYVMHRQRSDKKDPMTELSIEFSIELIDNENDAYTSENKHLIDILSRKYTRPFQFGKEILDDFHEIINNLEKKPLGYYLYTQVLIMKLIINVIRTVATHTEETFSYNVPEKTVDEIRIDRVFRCIEVHLNTVFKASDAAKMFNISPKQLNRIMVKHTGMTFNENISTFRYKSALNMLKNTELDVSDIALSTGFSSAQQMYRAFIKYNGMSPREVRKQKMSK